MKPDRVLLLSVSRQAQRLEEVDTRFWCLFGFSKGDSKSTGIVVSHRCAYDFTGLRETMVLNAIQRADWGGLLRGVVAGVLALGGSLIACAEAGGPERKLIEIFLTPNVAAVEPGGKVQFVVTGSWSDGSDLIPVSTFEATGGSIQPLGEFTAGSATGTFSVVARATGTDITDTAEVTITATPPVLQSISLSPASSSVTPGGSIQFAVSGTMSDGSSTTPLVVYSATGGLITPLGRFTAGSSLGTFRVIATQFGGSLADTSTVTIDAPTAATPFLVEDWSTYTSTANFHSDPRSIYDNESSADRGVSGTGSSSIKQRESLTSARERQQSP
jgi:hypothetical protein